MFIDFEALPKAVAIVGSRSFEDDKQGKVNILNEVFRFVYQLSDDTVVISGGARGVDTYAIRAQHFYSTKPLPIIHWPNKTIAGPAKYHMRNKEIVSDIKERGGIVVAFIDVYNWRGTYSTITEATEQEVPWITLGYKVNGEFREMNYSESFAQYFLDSTLTN